MDLSPLLQDYHFDLPQELVAQEPATRREDARLLVVRRDPTPGQPRLEDLKISDLPQLIEQEPILKQGLWLRNRTKVLPARFWVWRDTGGRHEVVLNRPTDRPHHWHVVVRNVAAFKYPQKLYLAPPPGVADQDSGDSQVQLARKELQGKYVVSPEPNIIDFSETGIPIEKLLECIGEMPLPPYIKTRNRKRDWARYQTRWALADKALSAAAPTASLHFTEELVARMNVEFADLCLHVGLGTFEPVRVDRLDDHRLHPELIEVSSSALKELDSAVGSTRPLIAVGTTALRCVESLGLGGRFVLEQAQLDTDGRGGIRGWTSAFVKPGFEIRYVKALMTNFHLPESTLVVLVSTFVGSRTLVLEAYQHAIRQKYRFFSFGDASIWL